jgi:hypothetical protein
MLVFVKVTAAYSCCRLPCRRANDEIFGNDKIKEAKDLDPDPKALKEGDQNWAKKDRAGECGDPTCKKPKPRKVNQWAHCRKCGQLFHKECVKDWVFKDGKNKACTRCLRDLKILKPHVAERNKKFDEQAQARELEPSDREQKLSKVLSDAKVMAAGRCFFESAKDEGHGLTLTFKPAPREPPTAGGAGSGNALGSAAGALGGAAGALAAAANNPLLQMAANVVAPGVGGVLLAGVGNAAGAAANLAGAAEGAAGAMEAAANGDLAGAVDGMRDAAAQGQGAAAAAGGGGGA